MNPVAKMLVIGGIVLIVAGLLWQFGGKYLHLGRLPGDIDIDKGNFRFYFPVMTCLVISVVLSVILYIIRLFK